MGSKMQVKEIGKKKYLKENLDDFVAIRIGKCLEIQDIVSGYSISLDQDGDAKKDSIKLNQ